MATRKKTIVNAIKSRSSICASESPEKKPEHCLLSLCSRLRLSQFLEVPLRRLALSDQGAPHHEPREIERNESTQIEDDDTGGPFPGSARR